MTSTRPHIFIILVSLVLLGLAACQTDNPTYSNAGMEPDPEPNPEPSPEPEPEPDPGPTPEPENNMPLPDCVGDGECSVGEVCLEGFCTAVVCEASVSECVGNAVQTCNDSGTGFLDLEECGEGLCVNGACAEVRCEPLESGCLDDETAFVCDETGTVLTESPCGEGRFCRDAECFPRVCEPSAELCDGNVLSVCDELGSEETRTDCDDFGDCPDALAGCRCVEGACLEVLCRPGEAECDGNAVRVCNDTGTGVSEPEDCGEDALCIEGGCLPVVCEAESVRCLREVLVICNEDGTEASEEDCGAANGFCNVIDGQCSPRVCAPGQPLCDGSVATVCDDRGAGLVEGGEDCADLDRSCIGGVCVELACDAIESFASQLGCEFWSVDLDNIEAGQRAAHGVILSNPGVEAAQIEVFTGGGEALSVERFADSVPPGEVRVYDFGDDLRGRTYVDGTMLGDESWRIVSSAPVTALQLNPIDTGSFTRDGSSLYPTHALGTDHVAMSWEHRGGGLVLRGYVTVLATDESPTTVTITPSAAIIAGVNRLIPEEPMEAIEAGESRDFTLLRGQFINLETEGPEGADLTGTRITSDRPVVVFGGHECANVPVGVNFCDHLEEQIPPVASLGGQHVVVPYLPEEEGDVTLLKIVAVEEDTLVRFDPPVLDSPVVTLASGETLLVPITSLVEVTSESPLLLAMFMRSSQAPDTGGVGDPAMVLVPPMRQWTALAHLSVPDDNSDVHLATIVAPIEASVALDGEAIEAFEPDESGRWQVARVELEAGPHVLEGDVAFGAYVHGTSRSAAYAFPVGSLWSE